MQHILISQIRDVEMSYMQGACGVSRWDGESNEETYGGLGMSKAVVGNGLQSG